MKKYLVILLIFLVYCTKRGENIYYEFVLIEKISKLIEMEPPPPYLTFAKVYFLSNSDTLIESGFVELKDVFNLGFKKQFSNYSDYLYSLINQKIRIDLQNNLYQQVFTKKFFPDEGIANFYHQNGIFGLLSKYCFKKKGFYELNMSGLTQNMIHTISYYMFTNKWIRSDDDYGNTINFVKIDSVIN